MTEAFLIIRAWASYGNPLKKLSLARAHGEWFGRIVYRRDHHAFRRSRGCGAQQDADTMRSMCFRRLLLPVKASWPHRRCSRLASFCKSGDRYAARVNLVTVTPSLVRWRVKSTTAPGRDCPETAPVDRHCR